MHIATSFSTYMVETGEDVEKALLLAKKDGFDAIGIVMSEPLDFYRTKKEQIINSSLKLCIHSNLTDTNIASINEGIRNESIKQAKDSITLASELGAKVVTIHPGKFRNTHYIQEAYFNLDNSINELISFADERGITLCLENMEPGNKDLCVTLTQIEKVLDRHSKLMLTLDLAHVGMVVENEIDMIHYYEKLKSRIKHFHISGLKPKMSHVEVSLKDSDIDFRNILNLIKNFDGIVRIENREREKNIESLKFIKEAINNNKIRIDSSLSYK